MSNKKGLSKKYIDKLKELERQHKLDPTNVDLAKLIKDMTKDERR